MKYLKTFEGLVDFIEKSMKSLMDVLSDDVQNVVASTVQSIEKSKDILIAKNHIRKLFSERAKALDGKDDTLLIQEVLKDDLSSTEIILGALSTKFKKDDFKPRIFFEKSNNKILKMIFSYDKVNNFQGSLDNNVKNLLIELGKKSGVENIEEMTEEETVKFKQTVESFRNTVLFKPFMLKIDEIIKTTKE